MIPKKEWKELFNEFIYLSINQILSNRIYKNNYSQCSVPLKFKNIFYPFINSERLSLYETSRLYDFSSNSNQIISLNVNYSKNGIVFPIERWIFSINFLEKSEEQRESYVFKKLNQLYRSIICIIKLNPAYYLYNQSKNYGFQLEYQIKNDEKVSLKHVSVMKFNDKYVNFQIEISYISKNEIFDNEYKRIIEKYNNNSENKNIISDLNEKNNASISLKKRRSNSTKLGKGVDLNKIPIQEMNEKLKKDNNYMKTIILKLDFSKIENKFMSIDMSPYKKLIKTIKNQHSLIKRHNFLYEEETSQKIEDDSLFPFEKNTLNNNFCLEEIKFNFHTLKKEIGVGDCINLLDIIIYSFKDNTVLELNSN